jgi:hypothetical protein
VYFEVTIRAGTGRLAKLVRFRLINLSGDGGVAGAFAKIDIKSTKIRLKLVLFAGSSTLTIKIGLKSGVFAGGCADEGEIRLKSVLNWGGVWELGECGRWLSEWCAY